MLHTSEFLIRRRRRVGGVTPTTQLALVHTPSEKANFNYRLTVLQKEKQITGTPAHPPFAILLLKAALPPLSSERSYFGDQSIRHHHHSIIRFFTFTFSRIYLTSESFTLSLNLSDLASHSDLSNHLRHNSTKTLRRRTDHRESH